MANESVCHAGVAPRHSQEFVRALLEHDEPLTFANSSGALQPPPLPASSPVQIPSRHKGHSPDTIRYPEMLACSLYHPSLSATHSLYI